MKWLQDKKNLPYIAGGLAFALIVAGSFIFLQMRGRSAPDYDPSTGSDYAFDQPAGETGEMPPGWETMGDPGAGAPPMPSPGMPGPADPRVTTVAVGADPQVDVVALRPEPIEAFRPDPFAPIGHRPDATRRAAPPPRLDVPSLGRIFPPTPPDIEQISDALIPQPPRRVAGILYGERVTALMETPQGYETIRAGDTLRDGSFVERIERDRVVLRTTDHRPRQVEVRLAASIVPMQDQGAPGTPFDGGRGFPTGGGFMPPDQRPM